MSRPFKFRYVHEITGTFVLLVLGLLIAGIFSAGRMQGWLDERSQYILDLPEDTPTGLRRGSAVVIFDTEVGTVRSIEVAGDEGIQAMIQVRGPLATFVREDSRAVVRKKFGLAGDAYVEITRGTGPALAPGAVIQASIDEDVPALLISTIREISDTAKYTMFQVNRLLQEYTELARSLREPVDRVTELADTLARAAEDLEAGTGSAGRVLKDPALHDEAVGLLRDIRAQVGRLDEILEPAREASARLPEAAGEAPVLLGQATETLEELERTLEALQRHWLLRRYAEEEEPPTYRIEPRGGGR